MITYNTLKGYKKNQNDINSFSVDILDETCYPLTYIIQLFNGEDCETSFRSSYDLLCIKQVVFIATRRCAKSRFNCKIFIRF